MALIDCYECNRQISDSGQNCPGCGAPVRVKQQKKGGRVPYTDREVTVMLSQKKNTSHLLHLVLSILTCGPWLVVWFFVAATHSRKNAEIDDDIKRGRRI